jgi:hypothetical protein
VIADEAENEGHWHAEPLTDTSKTVGAETLKAEPVDDDWYIGGERVKRDCAVDALVDVGLALGAHLRIMMKRCGLGKH